MRTKIKEAIASILSKQNYDCSFYHGGHPGTMGFDAYAEIADFDAYVDLSAYPNIEEDYDGKWGCLLYTSPSPRDATLSRMPSSA